MEVNEVDHRRLASELGEVGQADGSGQDVGLPTRLGYRDAVDRLVQGGGSGVCDKDAGFYALGTQTPGQQANVVFNPTDDRMVVLVQQQYSHWELRQRFVINWKSLP